jgi:IrrE N-terminal-like domain
MGSFETVKNDSIAEKRRAEKRRVYSWADSVHAMDPCNALPVDLFAVARRRQVVRAGFRLMVQRGVLVPVSGGFELLLRDLEPRDLDIETEEPQGALSPRQRFTFAHELAHTYFYEASSQIPTARKVEMIPPELEEVCDGAAGRILVPATLLKREISQDLSGNRERIDADFVRAMAVRFSVSHHVMINRLHVVESGNVFARCILLVRKKLGEAQIGACYMGLRLLSIFPKPKNYDSVANWLPELPRDILERDGGGRWNVTRRGHQLEIEKIPLGRSGDFLLQVDDPNDRAPTSK